MPSTHATKPVHVQQGHPGASSARDAQCDRFAAHRSAYARDGYIVIRNFLPEPILAGIQTDLEKIVDTYAEQLRDAGKLAGPDGRHDSSAGLPFSHRFTELYRANKFGVVNRGARSDLPAFFRKEGHTAGIYHLISEPRILELARCILPAPPPTNGPMRLYPVYMLRGKAPDALSGPGGSVDWHQDAAYTYYWYSELNTTRAQLDAYARSIVNVWVPVTDTTHDLGPVQFARRPSQHQRQGALTRADLQCRGCDDEEQAFERAFWMAKHEALAEAAPDNTLPPPQQVPQRGALGAQTPTEFLRVTDIDAYASADRSRLVTMAPLRRGDVVLFDQYTYHRGLPNKTPNSTRWSFDFRFQDGAADTLRSETGFIIQPRGENADAPAPAALVQPGTPVIRTADDWAAAKPSLRLIDLRQATGNFHLGGHDWAAQHMTAETLYSVVDLERRGYPVAEGAAATAGSDGYPRRLAGHGTAEHGRRLRDRGALRHAVEGSLLPDGLRQHD